MKIPRYWKQVFKHVDAITYHEDHYKAKSDNSADIYAWGYSDISEDDAQSNAESRVDQIIKALSSSIDENFYYPLNVLREDILEELSFGGKSLVTRNRYFSRVLNTDNMMFVDIDVPIFDIKPATFWQKLLGNAGRVEEKNKTEIKNRFKSALDKVDEYLNGVPDAGFIIYRTLAGYRLIASHRTFDPSSEETQQIFDALGTDPLYQKLCKAQECFRARLTPKFWRLKKDLGASPSIKYQLTKSMLANWTNEDAIRVKDYNDWVELYEDQHDSHATCQFIKHVGNQEIGKEIEELINYHDKMTKAHSGKPLA